MKETSIAKFDRYFSEYLSRGIAGGTPRGAWNYKDDLIVLGAYDLFCATGDLFYRDAIFRVTEGLLPGDDASPAYNLDEISAAKTDVTFGQLTGQERFRKRLLRKLETLRSYPRTASGNFWHKDIYPGQVWLDGLYMAMPVYLQDPANADDVLRQFESVHRILYSEKTHLYFHAWDENREQEWADPKTGLSPCVWLRAEGWLLMALADCYALMPRPEQSARLAQLLQEALDGLMPYQDPKTGMFLQLVDRPDLPGNYPETSGSAMVAYALMKGSRLGMLRLGSFQRGAGILRGIADTQLIVKDDRLVLDGICGSAGLGAGPDNRADRDGSPEYYLGEEVSPDNQHGVGACMMAYSEFLFGDIAGNAEKTKTSARAPRRSREADAPAKSPQAARPEGPLLIKVTQKDNVAVAVHDIAAGTELMPGVIARQDIPQAHKAALTDISRGEEVIRYGVVLGHARQNIPAGSWVNEHMLDLPQSPSLDDMPYGTNLVPSSELPDPPRKTWMGYRNAAGPAGVRNLLGIVTTVQCVAGVVKAAVERIRRELLPRYPNVDGVVAVTHPYGCGVAIDAPLAYLPIRAVRNVISHPSFGGEIMVVGLGCEKLTYDKLLDPEDITPENVLTLQDWAGYDAMMEAILKMADAKLQRLNRRTREELPLSDLLIGLQCGGSDAFSGLTANPSAGYAADMLVKGGATVLFSEVTEVRDGAHLLAARCVDAHTRDRLAEEMAWYDSYLAAGGVGRDANPTPGNKQGGLANIVEKAMGSIAKSGTSPIVEVLGPAEKPTKRGLIFAATPASDIVCGPSQAASGIGLQVFMTGRGTPYGLDIAPVIKVCSRNELKEHWFDLIDISAGPIATGEATIAQIGTEIFNLILDVASGYKQTCSDRYGLHNDMCIFNPAPIT